MESFKPSAIQWISRCNGDFYDCKNIESQVSSVPFAFIRIKCYSNRRALISLAILLIIIHQIFSRARDWSKRVK